MCLSSMSVIHISKVLKAGLTLVLFDQDVTCAATDSADNKDVVMIKEEMARERSSSATDELLLNEDGKTVDFWGTRVMFFFNCRYETVTTAVVLVRSWCLSTIASALLDCGLIFFCLFNSLAS